ncbi:MAG: thrombospondin type 3 repeat-containing protein, partial [Nitrosarchaeum sp.]|nr:thrombospondin type 3 repeat-containing protein [Nitrosarchaeum sp.]
MKLMLSLLAVTLGLAFLSWSNTGSFADMDKDGMPDGMDNCPENPNSDQADFDLDKIGDVCDEDDDNDGVIDSIDQFDNEATEWNDYDLDSIGDNKDTDDDNDGVIDSIDQFD